MFKWAYSINNKMKAAFLLTFVLLAIISKNILERNNISILKGNITSIVEDRLIPSNYIYQISNHLYQKKLIIGKLKTTNESCNLTLLQKEVQNHNQEIEKILIDFKKTYLVNNESHYLFDFENNIKDYNYLENEVFINPETIVNDLHFAALMNEKFDKIIIDLNELIKIQTFEGNFIEHYTQEVLANNKMLAQLEFSLLIIIVFAIQILIFASKTNTPKFNQQHHLN